MKLSFKILKNLVLLCSFLCQEERKFYLMGSSFNGKKSNNILFSVKSLDLSFDVELLTRDPQFRGICRKKISTFILHNKIIKVRKKENQAILGLFLYIFKFARLTDLI